MAAVASETFTSTSAPIQYAAVRAFEGGAEIERYLGTRVAAPALGAGARTVRQRLVDLGCRRSAGRRLLPLPRLQRRSPSRSRARGITDLAPAVRRACSTRPASPSCPGSDFGRPDDELTARLAYVDFDGARALAALEHAPADGLPADFIGTYCASVIEATDRIVRFVRNQPL